MASDVQQPSAARAPAVPPPPPDGATNRLRESSSPYLLQHAHNPVDWYPWGSEAIERARREDKPIFLSIGYAACHWCHVMEREVFEKPAIAAVMNQHFVNIKVDREERPDLDELYMLATQLMTGGGGWPMSVWLTPTLEPFYAGTYFPPEDAYGRPGFVRLENALADAWKNRRGDLIAQSQRIVEAIRIHADETTGDQPALAPGGELPVSQWLTLGLEQLADRFDPHYGGLGSAPKFPPHQALLLWLSLLAAEDASSPHDHQQLRSMLVKTLDAMAAGGIYDHVGGGFARYSTDQQWLVPHFEKMLYDSAQLAVAYAAASVVLQNAEYARIARETLDFFLREMLSPQGAFYSSLDADSQGAEGKYYVWTIADVRTAVGDPQLTDLVIAHFGLTDDGNWHESPVRGASVLAVEKPVEELARQFGLPGGEIRTRLGAAFRQMRAYRAKRPRPGLDDKILTSWNGLMVSALAIAGRVLREPRYLEAAHRLIGFLLTHHMEGGRRLLRVSRGGNAAQIDGFLDDHAFLLNGLMDLIDSTTPTSLPGTMARKRALELADELIRDFEDAAGSTGEKAGGGGFFYTGPHHEKLFARMKNAADNATPSANGVAIRALLRLARVSGKETYRDVALRAVRAFAPNLARRPEFFPTILLALAEDAAARHQRPGSASAATNPAAFTLGIMPPETAGSLAEARAGDSGLLQLSVHQPPAAQAGALIEIRLRLTVAGGYHIQPAQPTDPEAFKTLARLRSTGTEPVIASQEWMYPEPQAVDGMSGYAGAVEFRCRCTIAPDAPPGRHTLRAAVLAQPCSGSACLPPERISTEFPLTIA